MPLFRSQFKHYLHLMRFYQPVGTLLLLFPCWWGVLAATQNTVNFPLLALFVIGAFVMRGAGCIINDMWDRKIDAQVERTKHRPLASGAVSMQEAAVFLVIMLSIGAGVLLSLPPVVWEIALYSLPLVVLYPLMKRFFPLPQLFLGLTFNWGVLVGWVAVTGTIDLAPLILYAAAVFWTLGYDTIYACQDIADDKKVGVKSSALTFGRHTRFAVNLCYGMFALLLAVTGFALDVSLPFYILLGLLIGGWARVVDTWNETDVINSLNTFKKNSWLGLGVAVAFLLGSVDVCRLLVCK
jgi:4-hydroxybenzoate polyprenyltransferase